MKQKLFTLLLAVAASIGTMFAWDYERVPIGDLYYNLDATNQTAEVTYKSYTNYKYNEGWGITTANIPASVIYNSVTYSVTSIGKNAFQDCTGLTSVTIPNSVTSIGEWAFSGCTGLTRVNITDIAAWCNIAFSGSSSNPLYYAKHLYVNNVEVTNLVIPNSVTSIGKNAFYQCTGLTSVTIPNSVTSIGDGAFYGCTGLTSINVASDNSNYCSVDGVLFNKDKTTLIQYPGGKQGAYSIPNSVTSIGNGAFGACTGLTSVTIPNSVTSIGSSAFTSCTGLTSPVYNAHVFAFMPNSYSGKYTYSIPDGIESIAGGAFDGCSGLTSVTIPNSVTSIGDYAFRNCTGLTSVTIPNSVTSIGKNAFYQCTGLTSVTIPNSVTSIGMQAFYSCTGLTSVTIGNSVTSIGRYAFMSCTDLTSVTCFATTPPQLDYYVFAEVDKSIPLYVPAGSISAYKSANQWKDFSNILPIGAQPADVTTTTVTPSATTADIAWLQVTGAATYTIEIKKNGELICTLTFNAQGQLISIALAAPSRNNAPQRAQAAGFSFTVTSLDSGTTYSYTMTAKDNNGNVLKTESGTFTTTGDAQGLDEISSSLQGGDRGRLIYHEGQIFILRGEKVYTITGQEVK